MRLWAGTVIAFLYNALVGKVPSRTLRHVFLRLWLDDLGKGAGVQLGCRFLNGRKVRLGERTVVNFGTLIDGRRFPVTIGSDVSIGPEAAILTLGHDPQAVDFADRGGEVRIGDRAWIAYRAVVLPGVSIGEGAVVAAGAVVSEDVAPFTIVAGNPARPVGARNRELGYRLAYRPWLM
jgi:acetyltransferase-like isoleucine patch superfamily enzyme